MKKNFAILGLIPARSGSKGLKNKNILKIGKKSLIEFSIIEAKKCKKIKKLIISTDSKKIINISKNYDLETIKRPKKLCLDSTKIFDVIMHALKVEKKQKNEYDYVVLIQPTTPLKTKKMLDEGIKIIIKKKSDTLVSVYPVEDNHPARMYKINRGYLKPMIRNMQSQNRQDLSKIYHRDGNVYIFKVKSLYANNSLYGKKISPLIVNPKYKLNIDTLEDFNYAKYKMKKK